MTAPLRKRSTYRLTPELDKIVTEESKRLGISKNAFVQLTLAKALKSEDEQSQPTGTEGR